MNDISGIVLYEGPSMLDPSRTIVAIATLESGNNKTGNMVQVWILDRDTHPVEEMREEGDSPICGSCPLRGTVCYVRVDTAPTIIWHGYWRGIYPYAEDVDVSAYFEGRRIRWGAYGDPAALDLRLVHKFDRLSEGSTGYTHQWKRDLARAGRLAKLFMMSCDTHEDLDFVNLKGWRGFLVSEEEHSEAVECPYYTHGVQCIDCMLCCGNRLAAKHVRAAPHGRSKKRFLEEVLNGNSN